MSGTASFQTYEDNLRLTVEIKRSGQAEVSGTARRRDKPRVDLSFAVESDQTFLTETCSQLASVVQGFPVKTHVGQQ